MNIPDWLWQELAADAIWTGIGFSTAWAWKKRQAILSMLSSRQPVLLSGEVGASAGMEGTLTVGKSVEARWNVRSLISKDLNALWNVESPTPTLARRVEELASWYLHVT
jgi:hypothetical protein